MQRARAFRVLLILAAAFGYLADGARAHIQVSGGDTLQVMMCSPGGENRYIGIEIPGDTEELADKCCGDCAPASPIRPEHPAMFVVAAHYTPQVATHKEMTVSPRSPLWPGAPPNGPPLPHSA